VIKRPVELRLWLAMRNEFYPLLDEQGGIPRETRQRAQAETGDGLPASQLRRPPENDLLPVVERLRRREFLPAIYFIFSRRGWPRGAGTLRGPRLRPDHPCGESPDRRDHESAPRPDRGPDEAELYRNLVDGETLRRGWPCTTLVSSPMSRSSSKTSFSAGLIKVVFATETLRWASTCRREPVWFSSFTKFDGRDLPRSPRAN